MGMHTQRIRSSGLNKTVMAWRVVAQADSADMWLYDAIGEWGTPAKDFQRELLALGDRPIGLHVNSDGGDVFDALAMYAALKAHPATVTAYVDALAASAASFLVMAADRILIAKTASMMVHRANGVVIGPAGDMRKMADLLDDATLNIAEIYADRSGRPVKGWLKAMEGETWYRGQEAVDAGLADEVMAAPEKPQNKLETTADEPKGEPTQPDFAKLFAHAFSEVF